MRVFILGVDGLTFRVLDPLFERGYLPNFRRLREEGTWGILKSTIPPISPLAWAAISTGLRPAKHGLFDFWDFYLEDGMLTANLVTRRKSGKAIWELFSECGKKAIVLNVPLTYPPDPVNGIMVSGGAPRREASFVYPSDFQARLFDIAPNYNVSIVDEMQVSQSPIDCVLEATEARIKVLEFLLEQEWTLFFGVFTGADYIQHRLWSALMKLDSRVLEYYQQIDAALGMIMSELRAGDVLLVISDHGFRGASQKFYINRYLERMGFLRVRPSYHLRSTVQVGWLNARLRVGPLLSRLGLKDPNVSLWNRFQRIRRRQEVPPPPPTLELAKIDWLRTRACVPSGSGVLGGYADVFLLPTDIGTPSTEMLAADLEKLVNPETGQPVAQVLSTTDDLIGQGPHCHRWPHLILLSAHDCLFPIDIGGGRLFEKLDRPIGVHDSDGVLLAWGGGAKTRFEVTSATVYDIMPTALYAAGLPIPNDVDGRVLKEIFEFERPVTRRDVMTGAVFEEGASRRQVSEKLARLLREGTG